MPWGWSLLKQDVDVYNRQRSNPVDNAFALLRRFHQRRLRETKEALLAYTEGQIRNARLNCDEMRRCVNGVRDFPLPQRSKDFVDGDEDDRRYN